MASRAEDAGAAVVLIAPGLPEETVMHNPIGPRYAEAVRGVADRGGHALVDAERLFRESGLSDAELFIDFCHPTSRGHSILADAILAATGLVDD